MASCAQCALVGGVFSWLAAVWNAVLAPYPRDQCILAGQTRILEALCFLVDQAFYGEATSEMGEGRTGRNPRTGATVPVGRKAVHVFRSGKEMKSLLNAHGSDIDAGEHG
jgi:hypothetical protein